MQLDQMWNDLSAPYNKVGCLTWKDLKTIQKEMPVGHEKFMRSLTREDIIWEIGWLNDEVEIEDDLELKKGHAVLVWRKILLH